MPYSSDRKSKPARARTSRLLDEHEPELGPKRQSRLHLDDDEYVRTKMIATGKTEAAVIRNLVRKGAKAERLERAARDPVVNALLRVMNDVVGSHTSRLERRLSLEFHTLRRLTATAIVLAHAALRILETYVAVEPPSADAEVVERKKAYFNSLYRRFIGEAESIMERMLDERDDALSLLVEKELITALRDEDLDATLRDLKVQHDGGPDPGNN